MMTFKLVAARTLTAKKVAVLLAAVAVAAVSLSASDANAAKRKYTDGDGSTTAGNPNTSYQSGPRTRVYITRRSWLDAGTEVLPGERKFMDYAYPPGVSFGQENRNRPLDRQPLNPPSDFGFGDAYPSRFPLY
jgi:hypothetical protein